MSSQEQLILNFLEDIVHALKCPNWTAKILERWCIAPKRSPTPDMEKPQEDPPDGSSNELVDDRARADHRKSSQELEIALTYDM